MAATVLITGASQGIGKAIAFLFARNGYNVILAARQADRLEAVAQELQKLGYSALAIPTDVRNAEQVKELVTKGLVHYGAIDILINNAGIYISGPVDQFSLDDWHLAIDTNLWGYIHTIHALLPHFLERGSGAIVNLSSIGGKVPIPYLVPYNTSKYAVTGMTQALQSELSPKGIHVCGIYPSLIKSDLLERAVFRGINAQDEQARRRQLEQVIQVPMIEQPEDVAKAVWDAVKHRRSEVIVGSANLSLASNRMFPKLMQGLLRKIFQNKESD